MAGFVQESLRTRFPSASVVKTMLPSDEALALPDGPFFDVEFHVEGHGWWVRRVELRPVSSIDRPEVVVFPPASRTVSASFVWRIEPPLAAFPGCARPRLRLDGEIAGRSLLFVLPEGEERVIPFGRYSVRSENAITARCLTLPAAITFEKEQDGLLSSARSCELVPVKFSVELARGMHPPCVDVTVTDAARTAVQFSDWSPWLTEQVWTRASTSWLPPGWYDVHVRALGCQEFRDRMLLSSGPAAVQTWQIPLALQ
jgi:hypothetical protein